MVQVRPWYHDYPGKPQHCYGIVTTLAKPGIRPTVNLCNGISDLRTIHLRKCKNGKKEVSLVA
jgi:hypothetical protein